MDRIYIEKATLIKFFINLIAVVFSGILLFNTNSIIVHTLILTVLVLVAISTVNFSILHPYTWFLPFFLLYAIAHPLLIELNWYSIESQNLEQVFIAQWLAFAVFILCVGPKVYNIKFTNYKNDIGKMLNLYPVLIPIYIGSLLLVCYYLLQIMASGATVKVDITNESSFGGLNSFASITFLTYGLLLMHSLLVKNRVPIGLMIFTFIWAVVTFLISGERDILLSIVLISVFLIYLFKQYSNYLVILIGIICLSSVPILQNLKNFFLVGSTRGTLSDNLFIDLLRSEFNSSSKNLSFIVSNFNEREFLYGKSIIWDLNRAVFNVGHSTTQWFNDTFYATSTHGQGFSLVGEGYVNFGYFGVILWFIILSLFVRFFYWKSRKSAVWLVIYILAIPTIIYVTRADFANLFSGVIKQIILPLFILYFLKNLLEYSKNSKKEFIRKGRKKHGEH